MTVVLSGHQVVRENHLLAVMLVPVETLLVQDQIQDHLVESGLLKDLLVMTEHLAESGLLKDHSVMTELLVVNGLLRDLLVMIVLLVVSGVILVQLVMTEVQEILVDQIAWKEMTTVSVHSMALETSLQTKRLSLKM
jgi:hypothetical protein